MADLWGEWILVVVAVLLAAMSPGPDFIVTVRHAVGSGRKAGLMTALGLGAGVCVHVGYCLSGIAALVSQSILLFSVLKFLGAGYLLYLGWGALRSPGTSIDPDRVETQGAEGLSSAAAFRKGFLTNLLNPKATLFFLALFTQIVSPGAPLSALLFYGLSAASVVVLWFCLVSVLLTTPAVRRRFLAASRWIDRVCGAFFVMVGVRLALARAPGP
ncbi:MAG TPA: LysE family transporter [Alphaproteobacteria bacterium]|nr:LysE family transporter [Alphaproteobacteria bacterium]